MPEFPVDNYAGTDSQRFAAACSAAIATLGTVILPERELRLTTPNPKVRPGVSGRGGLNSGFYLDFPGAAAPAGNAPSGPMILGGPTTLSSGSVWSDFSIRGRDTGYYRLLVGQQTRELTIADVEFGVCGQSFVELRDVTNGTIANVLGRYGGDNSYDRGSSKYKVAIVNCNHILIEDVELGHPDHDRNQSFITINASHDVRVVDPILWGTRTYCLNTHGTGSTGVVFEGGTLRPGLNALYGAVLVGNEAWGPDLDVTLLALTMVGGGRFLQLRAGSEAWLVGIDVPLCNELVGFGPGGGTAHITDVLP